MMKWNIRLSKHVDFSSKLFSCVIVYFYLKRNFCLIINKIALRKGDLNNAVDIINLCTSPFFEDNCSTI